MRDDAWTRGGAQAVHGRHALDTRRPLGKSPEQVAGNDVATVGCIFGLAPG
jgi:hypothetical protein